MTKKALFNWSGGKDTAFALGELLKNKEIENSYLFSSLH